MRRAMFANLNHQRGVTLIELVVFIAIVGVIVSSLAAGFSSTLKGSTLPMQMTLALQLAQERMELIRARKDVVGFACFTGTRFDPCTPAAAVGTCPLMSASTHPACSAATTFGYTVTRALDETGACMDGTVNYKCIKVTVTDASGAKLAELQAAVADY